MRRLKTVPRANSVPKDSIGAATVANGGVGKAGADCKKGELVLGGGGRWADVAPGQSIQSSRRLRHGLDRDRVQRERSVPAVPGVRDVPGALKGDVIATC